jgi:dinuclear metal center YbgI/SA1388 family protein
VCLDCTEDVLDEAIKNGHNLIVSHHPILFNGVKKIVGANYVEKILSKSIKHNIAIYAMHTNLDNLFGGVSFEIAKKIPLDDVRVLKPKANMLTKLSFYCPKTHTETVKNELFARGAGKVSDFYDRCSFVSNGEGSFRPLKDARPFSGKKNQDSFVEEDKIEVIFNSYLKPVLLSTLTQFHPYEEVAYSFTDLSNTSQNGSGVIGELDKSISLIKFLDHIKDTFKCKVIKCNKFKSNKKIQKIAICGGSGRFLLEDAIKNKADIFITSDFKYHDFFDCNDQIIVLDIGHYESEYCTQDLIFRILKEKFSKLAVHLTTICTNPIIYY